MDARTGLFYVFALVLLFAAFKVITARNPVHAALYLVLAFFQAAAVWILLKAEFLAITLVLVYVGAVMVLFLFVVMMLDVNMDGVRKNFWKHFPLAATVGTLIALEMAAVLIGGFRPSQEPKAALAVAGQAVEQFSNTKELGKVLYSDPCQECRPGEPGEIAANGGRPGGHIHRGKSMMVTLGHFLTLGAILFALSVIGIFLNRKNLIVLLMAIELMLLAVNMNFVAFSYYLNDMAGQIFVFFILTVAAAESAIGLAILVLLFRNKSSINVDELNTLKG
jgi:NADH:ubiquinone oxidoreductase subunit 6 (subunit J)/NADH:ubiquinone oxidoreductase subunit K